MAGMSYPAILDAAWADHLKPKAPDALTVISLFAGCGGSSLGYSMAGYRELLAVEWEENAVATFRANFPEIPVYHGDIANLSVEDVLTRCKLRPGELDVLDGSPPCQGFSTAGKRKLGDSRNQLFQEYVRLLRGLQPRAFIMENVSGMVKGKMKLIFAEILRELKASGYQVSARLMNSKYFNVPQSRERMIFSGIRSNALVSPTHPAACRRAFTVREAVETVRNSADDIKASCYKATSECHKLLLMLKQGEKGCRYHSSRSSYFSLCRLEWDKPSRTVLKGDGGGAACSCCHPSEHRRLTIPELMRIQSFPGSFRFFGPAAKQWERIGNSVPPLFMREIAEHVKGILSAAERAA